MLKIEFRQITSAFMSAAVAALLATSVAPNLYAQKKLTARDIVVQLHQSKDLRPIFADQDISRLDLAMLDFSNVNLARSDLFGADLTGANFKNANLSHVRLDRSTITSANFEHANLSGATILRPNIFSTLSMNTKELAAFDKANLTGAHLSGDLRHVSFRNATLTNATFGAKDSRSEELITSRVDLRGCDFTSATLVRTVFSNNEVSYARFTNANLREAKFINANLTMTDFRGADITAADFTGARLDDAKFEGAKGTETAIGLP